MKSYKNKTEHFLNCLEPSEGRDTELFNLFNIFSQDKFNKYLSKNIELEVAGEVTNEEEEVIQNIKAEIKKLQKMFPDVKSERLEFDLAKIFHSNLKRLGFGRFHVDDVGMWRWMSMQYFKEETFWRRGKSDFDKRDYTKAAKATFEHCVGKRSRDIFPRRYYIIGQRLFDANEKYILIDKLAEKSRSARTGGFGNLIANMVETKLISPNDYVSKIVSKIMFTESNIGDDKEVRYAFIRYNAYRKRLLNNAAENVFKNEICLMEE
jgi:hypothetical protein